MIDKRVATIEDAVAGIRDGATILIGGFGDTGTPFELIHAVLDTGVRDLVIVSNNAGNGYVGIAALLDADRVRKVVCSYPRSSDCVVIDKKFKEGKVEVELVPQGTLVERMRCGGAGIHGFYTRTAAGTPLAEGKEERIIDGVECVLEKPLRGDIALIKAAVADRWGNLVYSKTARNFNPIMATAADLTVVQAGWIAELGDLDPELVGTPGIFVDRVVAVGGTR
ncbi:MAG TPA: 3-oxoacid CoA-transferase subunit A [Dongiaceae bacterium]|nr:3-oxoacid CoA-transferase subunit A [Dongiaceae bacterium]